MFVYSDLGWLVPIIRFGSIAALSKVVPNFLASSGSKFPAHWVIFLFAAVVSAALCFLPGKLLNKNKVKQTIRPFGKERIVLWGRHTFCLFPVEHWAIIIPIVTLFASVIIKIV